MNLDEYIETSEAFYAIAGASNIGASRALLKAATIMRDKLRKQIERKPLEKDVILKLGEISGLNFIINLPEMANDHIKSLPEGDIT